MAFIYFTMDADLPLVAGFWDRNPMPAQHSYNAILLPPNFCRCLQENETGLHCENCPFLELEFWEFEAENDHIHELVMNNMLWH